MNIDSQCTEIAFTMSTFKGKAISVHWESMFTRSSFQTPDMIAQHQLLNDVADLIDKGVLRTTLDQTLGTINAANLKRAHALLDFKAVGITAHMAIDAPRAQCGVLRMHHGEPRIRIVGQIGRLVAEHVGRPAVERHMPCTR